MLVRDVLLDERRRFEKLLADLAAELPFVFLLDTRLNRLGQLPKNIPISTRSIALEAELNTLIIVLPSVVTRIDVVAIYEQSDLRIQPF